MSSHKGKKMARKSGAGSGMALNGFPHNAHRRRRFPPNTNRRYPIEDDSAERAERIKAAFGQLTETQQRRLRPYADGKTLRVIATLENTRFQSVAESIEAAKKKFLKNYRPAP